MKIEGMLIDDMRLHLQSLRDELLQEVEQAEKQLDDLRNREKTIRKLLSLCESLCGTSAELQELMTPGMASELKQRVERDNRLAQKTFERDLL